MEKAVMVHGKPLAQAEPPGVKGHTPNYKSDKLSDADEREMRRLSKVVLENLECHQTPLTMGQGVPCFTCRQEILKAMMLYLNINNLLLDAEEVQ